MSRAEYDPTIEERVHDKWTKVDECKVRLEIRDNLDEQFLAMREHEIREADVYWICSTFDNEGTIDRVSSLFDWILRIRDKDGRCTSDSGAHKGRSQSSVCRDKECDEMGQHIQRCSCEHFGKAAGQCGQGVLHGCSSRCRCKRSAFEACQTAQEQEMNDVETCKSKTGKRLKMEGGEAANKSYPLHCSGCMKLASSLRCPTCVTIGLPDSYWCGQDCFKANWSVHKSCHAFYGQLPDGPWVDRRFHSYAYTGPLRKGLEGPSRLVPPEIKRPVYVTHPRGVDPRETDAKREKLIACNTAKEIALMREACRLGREVLDEAHRACRPGITTDEIDRIVHEACIERGCYPSPLGYGHFPKSCCTSVNEVVCHGIPDTTVLKDGDIINVDVSVYYKGMHADLNETYCVGNVDAKGRELVAATYDCLWRAIQMCKPGVLYRDVGDVITKEAKLHKLSVVRTYCGHGVGELFHCSPTVPHYANNKATGRMQAGHIFTIEPMINEGDWKRFELEVKWPDDWTSTTSDGKRSAQFEETLLITETGVEVLTKGSYIPEGSRIKH